MPLTTNGLPYPLGTDPVANGAQDIEDLATTTDVFLGLWYVASGTLSLTTTPTNVTGVFGNKYRNYRVILNTSAHSTTQRFDIKYLVGTSPTSQNYYQGGIASEFATNATVYMQRSNNDNQFFGVSGGTGDIQNVIMDIIEPNFGAPTVHSGQHVSRNTGFAFSFGGVNTTNNVFTGFQLFTSTGTMTVEYQVFGYRD
jgi:hypothetical protein